MENVKSCKGSCEGNGLIVIDIKANHLFEQSRLDKEEALGSLLQTQIFVLHLCLQHSPYTLVYTCGKWLTLT